MNEYLQDEREIKGYVEIEYYNIDNTLPVSVEFTYPSNAPISEFINSQNEKISQNYASLEEDYFLLDGSFVLPYKPENQQTYYNKNSGYISSDIVQNWENATIEINSISKSMNGITIYLKDNIPEIIYFQFINSNNELLNYYITNNTKDIIQIKFDEEQTITDINIVFSDFEYLNRRFRISMIDFGLSDILKDDNLINFNIIENIGDLNLEFPTNQLTVTLYDEDDTFDINNPKGYADFLNQGMDVKLKPHIGILTKNDGIKYNEDLPIFYLQNWSNNKNEITLNCVDYLEKLKTIKNNNENGELVLTESNCENLDVALENKAGIEVNTMLNFTDNQNYLCDHYVATTNTFEYLQQLMIWLWGYIYIENDKIIIDKRENTINYNNILSLESNLLEEPKYTLRDKIKSISITQYTGYHITDEKVWQEADTIYLTNSEKAYNNQPEIVEFDNYHELHVEANNISQNIGIYKVINASDWCPAVISPATNITFYDLGSCTFNTEIYKKIFNDIGKEITIDNKFFIQRQVGNLNSICELICNKINNENKKYNVSINYVGDPNIKPNMLVPIETQYGEKEIKVLKHTLTFNGGLTGTIEGVGD